MRDKLASDLTAWEKGEVSLSVLKARYPNSDVDGLTAIYSTFKAVSEEPVRDPAAGWNEVRSRMASRRMAASQVPPTLLQRLRPGVQRRLVFGLAAALLAIPPVALAANTPAVRGFVEEVILDLPTDEPAAPAVDPSTELPAGGGDFSANENGDGQSISGGPAGGAAGGAVASQGRPGNTPAPSGTAATGSGSGGTGDEGKSGADNSGADGQSADSAEGVDGADASPSPSPSPTPTEPAPGVAGASGGTTTP